VVSSHGRFAWYELITTDTKAAKTFYTRVMGWGALDASVAGTSYTLFTAGKVAASGLIELPEDARTTGAKPYWFAYVGVDDVDAAAARVRRLGGAVQVPPTDLPDISRFSIFADPQSARLAVLKWLNPDPGQKAGPDAPGHVGWHELLAADWETALAFYGELFGWQKADADVGAAGTYQLFSAGGETIGGMLTKPPSMPAPFWLYYFNVADLDAAVQRVKAGGGRILDDPQQVPGGSWIVQCTDPQGAMFALEGPRRYSASEYLERVASRDPSAQRRR
jgi:predicted enzyme related to lactoylglutathione lyase